MPEIVQLGPPLHQLASFSSSKTETSYHLDLVPRVWENQCEYHKIEIEKLILSHVARPQASRAREDYKQP